MGSQNDPTPVLEAPVQVHPDRWVLAVATPKSSSHHDGIVEAVRGYTTHLVHKGTDVYAQFAPADLPGLLDSLTSVTGGSGIGIAHGAAWWSDTPVVLAGPVVEEARALAKKAGPGGLLATSLLAQTEVDGLDLTDASPLARFWCAGIEGERDLLWMGAHAGPTARRAPLSLPEPASPWVGRPDLTRRLGERLRLGGPLVLVGPPGSGKTRTAQRIAWRAAAKGARVVWASLTRIDGSCAVNATVHDALGANLTVAPLDLSGLLDRSSPDLVVLDAAEQCLDEVEAFVERWAMSPRSTRVLITSRRAPQLLESELIPPMSSPHARILVRWVTTGGAGPVKPNERGWIDRCGGQPAALIRMAQEATQHIHGGPHEGAPGGFQVRIPPSDVARSFAMLTPPVLEALLQLAVFEGPFTENAAREIVNLDGYRHAPMFERVMSTLRAHSMVQAVVTPDEVDRDSVPFTVRATALATLGRSGRRTAVGSRHTHWGIRRGRALAERVRQGDPRALIALSVESADLRAIAKRRARTGTADALAALLALVPLKIAESPLPERVAFLREAMALAARAPLDLRSETRRALSEALLAQGKFEEAKQSLSEADQEVTQTGRALPSEGLRIAALRVQLHRLAGEIEEARQIAYLALEQAGDDRVSKGTITTELAVLQHAEGDLELALSSLMEAMNLLRDHDTHAYCRAAKAAGDVLRAQGKGTDAARYYEQAKSYYTSVGERTGRARVLHAIGSLHLDHGEFDAARHSFEEAQAHHVDVGDQRGAALTCGNLARLHHMCGDVDAAKKYYQDAILRLDEIGDTRFAHIYRANEGTLLHEQGDFDRALQAYQESIQPLLRMGDRRFAAMFLGRQAALEADGGATIEALQSLEQAERLLGDTTDPVLKATLSLHRAHVQLESSHDRHGAIDQAKAALSHATSPAGHGSHSYDVRVAQKMLSRRLSSSNHAFHENKEAVVA